MSPAYVDSLNRSPVSVPGPGRPGVEVGKVIDRHVGDRRVTTGDTAKGVDVALPRRNDKRLRDKNRVFPGNP